MLAYLIEMAYVEASDVLRRLNGEKTKEADWSGPVF